MIFNAMRRYLPGGNSADDVNVARRREAVGPRGAAKRRGAIAAELAMTLPLLCMITFGSIQIANTIHFKQALTTAVYEGTRQATGVTSERAKVEERVRSILDARKIVGAKISITPAGEFLLMPSGTPVAITVTAPIQGNVTGPTLVRMSSSITVTGRTVR